MLLVFVHVKLAATPMSIVTEYLGSTIRPQTTHPNEMKVKRTVSLNSLVMNKTVQRTMFF